MFAPDWWYLDGTFHCSLRICLYTGNIQGNFPALYQWALGDEMLAAGENYSDDSDWVGGVIFGNIKKRQDPQGAGLMHFFN